MNSLSISKPRKQIVSLAEACRWLPGRGVYQIKKDGAHEVRTFETPWTSVTLALEVVRPRSGAFITPADRELLSVYGEILWAHTLLAIEGENLEREHLRSTMPELRRIVPELALHHRTLHLMPEIEGGEAIPFIMAEGEEGAVAKPLDMPPGEMLAVKQNAIYVCEVVRMGMGQTVLVRIQGEGKTLTGVSLFGGKCDQVRQGSVIRVEGMGLTEGGKIREPRLCTDWLFKY